MNFWIGSAANQNITREFTVNFGSPNDFIIKEQFAPRNTTTKMFARTATRVSPMAQMAARRGFHSTRSQMASPYHYPEGPRNNLPFNPLTKFFALRYWSFMALGFGAPFGIAVWQTKKNQ
ncbi:hypothetical protein O988_04669 [Pseudogymnoascus sp. VKM F-3808]|nr:hypothetical protein O988_04669 [Pseudogymnoascus sp. VKM F-3808]KFY39572.1 hypothetical protein V495_05882 [Pseudogymnoascus sp. VKM F-4514 (FW-929)]KFY56073.1 hypothetical protein V497_06522 [Pseudogymnoascus sp. VKM F-4516 (FW-969)]